MKMEAMRAQMELCASPFSIASGHSLEITVKDIGALSDAADAMIPGTQVSITFLPSETWELRVQAAAAVRRLDLEPMPHIAARKLHSKLELEEFLAALRREVLIDRAFVIAGDGPLEGPYEDALSVIRSGLLSDHGVTKVGIAGYPDGHPAIEHSKLWQALLDKRESLRGQGQDVEIITQFAFDAGVFLEWIERVRGAGISDLIRIGIPGPASVKTLLRFAARCGVSASAKVMARYGLSLSRLMSPAGPDEMLDELRAKLDPRIHGATSLHLYPFGGIARTIDYLRDYGALNRPADR